MIPNIGTASQAYQDAWRYRQNSGLAKLNAHTYNEVKTLQQQVATLSQQVGQVLDRRM